MENENKFKAAVIGMGPSGVAAAIYLKRSGIDPLCFETGEVGGKLNKIAEIENYPGFVGSGIELAQKMQDQVKHFEIKVKKEEVRSITQEDDGSFTIKTSLDSYHVLACIICAGIREKPFTVKGSETYHEGGISRCAECDAPFHKNKPVALIGDSNEAIKDATYLATVCKPVYLICPREQLQADPEEVKKFASNPDVKIFAPYQIKDSSGTRHIEKLTIENLTTKENLTLDVDALFIFLGATPMSEFLNYMDVLDDKGNIKTDEHMKTSVPGLFAAGDISNTVLRQVITAVADGGVAAVSCRSYLHSLEEGK
jgi:thioredoxin reductase (NADPH)